MNFGSANYMHIYKIESAAAFMKPIREISNIRSGVDLSIEQLVLPASITAISHSNPPGRANLKMLISG